MLHASAILIHFFDYAPCIQRRQMYGYFLMIRRGMPLDRMPLRYMQEMMRAAPARSAH